MLVHRSDDECLGWWVRCGHFDITYPLYHKYYVNLKMMSKIIDEQNKDLLDHWHKGTEVFNNLELATLLDIGMPPEEYRQNYANKNVMVTVL